MTQEEIKNISQEYAEIMAKFYPEIREKTKFRDKMAQAENVIRLLQQKYDIIYKRDTAKKQTVTIDAWVARDINKVVALHRVKPECWEGFYLGNLMRVLDKNDFPEVTFENSPKKVKVTIELEEKQ